MPKKLFDPIAPFCLLIQIHGTLGFFGCWLQHFGHDTKSFFSNHPLQRVIFQRRHYKTSSLKNDLLTGRTKPTTSTLRGTTMAFWVTPDLFFIRATSWFVPLFCHSIPTKNSSLRCSHTRWCRNSSASPMDDHGRVFLMIIKLGYLQFSGGSNN